MATSTINRNLRLYNIGGHGIEINDASTHVDLIVRKGNNFTQLTFQDDGSVFIGRYANGSWKSSVTLRNPD